MSSPRAIGFSHAGIARAGIAAVILLGLAACQNVAPRPGTSVSPAKLAPLQPLVIAGSTHYRINSDLSDVRFLVYRSGPLARFGHNHVIRAGTVTGDVYLNPDFDRSGFDLRLPVADFRVDEPHSRRPEGPKFATQPSPADIAGTRRNMLGAAILDAGHYPVIRVRSVHLSGSRTKPEITFRVELRGVQRDLTAPVAIRRGDGRLTATGHFQIKQTSFGITPYSILGGGLTVRNEVTVRFRIVAERR